MPQEVYHHTYPNGLTLLAERMEHVRSAAFNFLVPAGCAHDPPGQLGVAGVLAEMMTRGAGDRDSHELTLALDGLGLDRSESAGILHMHFAGSTLSRNLPAALECYADILLRPHLPEEEMEAVRALALQDLQGLEDEPRQKVFIELRRRHHPPPLNQDHRGERTALEALTIREVRGHYRRLFRPRGTLLSVAGNLAWEPLRDLVGRLFGDWQGGPGAAVDLGQPVGGNGHLDKETTQTQIAMAYPSVPPGDPDYYQALGAVNVLSGGMSARLLTEVREKRGLCYSVSASYSPFKERASILVFAGTTNERAQETLDVTLAEVLRLADGVEVEEVERVQAGLKSSLIMQEESTGARARSLASDWYYLGRVRPLEEVQAAVDGLTPASILAHLRRWPAQDFTIVTLGPKALTTTGTKVAN